MFFVMTCKFSQNQSDDSFNFDLPGEAPSCVTGRGSFAEEMPSFHESPGEDAAKTSDLQKNHGDSVVILSDLMRCHGDLMDV